MLRKKSPSSSKGKDPICTFWGSGNLLQTLMKHDLVDNFGLMIYPITLGEGKRLFAEGTIPAAFKVTESIVGSNGAILGITSAPVQSKPELFNKHSRRENWRTTK